MIKKYRKYIAESRSIVYISALLALVLRWGFFISLDNIPVSQGGILWNAISPLFSNSYVSFFASYIFTIGIAFFAGLLSEKHSLIRGRTSLPFVFIVFLTSCFPSFLFISPFYFSIVFFLLALNVLFDSYQQDKSASFSFSVGFLLAFGSLFTLDLLFYFPVFWMGFRLMRCLNFKTFLGSLTGCFVVYWLLFCYYLYEGIFWDSLSIYAELFSGLARLSILRAGIHTWIILAVTLIISIFIILYSYINEFKDKIQVRANMSEINIILVFSFLLYIVFPQYTVMSLIVLFISGSFVYAHYFALITKKWEVYFFIGIVIFYLIVYVYMLKFNINLG